ncbi:hypothetical protein KEM54_004612 [Ascosphaera aggregata]|nr:hypothetical protein KEM54_004612 [Ascosphaera aggregata]
MKLSKLLVMSALSGLSAARLVAYIDQYHNSTLPSKELTSEITHVVLAFVQSYMLYNTSSIVKWWDLPEIKSHFHENTTFMISIGGDTDYAAGFGQATKSQKSQQDYAKKVADFVKREGFNGVDIDWKQPGGISGSETQEIAGFPPLLKEIRKAIGDNMTLSIAAPGVEKYMFAYTKDSTPVIFSTVDFANILTEDQLDGQSPTTTYLSGISSSNKTIAAYLDRGMPAAKGNLGMPFYGQGYTVEPDCEGGLGCKVIRAGETLGNITGKALSITWTPDYLASSSLRKNFSVAEQGASNDSKAVTDEGAFYLDKASNMFWTWDPESLYPRKYKEVVRANGLGGIMVWSLGEDSYDWSHLKKLSDLSKGNKGKH